MNDDIDDFLMHFGVKGMKWGHHKTQTTSGGERTGLSRNQKIAVGVGVGIGVVAVGALLARNKGVKLSDITNSVAKGKAFTARFVSNRPQPSAKPKSEHEKKLFEQIDRQNKIVQQVNKEFAARARMAPTSIPRPSDGLSPADIAKDRAFWTSEAGRKLRAELYGKQNAMVRESNRQARAEDIRRNLKNPNHVWNL